MSFNVQIWDSSDVVTVIDKLIEEAVRKAIEDIEAEYDVKLDDLRDELHEANSTIDELRSTIDDLEEQLNAE